MLLKYDILFLQLNSSQSIVCILFGKRFVMCAFDSIEIFLLVIDLSYAELVFMGYRIDFVKRMKQSSKLFLMKTISYGA